MAYPDGTTVIRYYPIERFNEEWVSNGSLPMGISIWVKRVDSGEPLGDLTTTLYPDDEYPDTAFYREGPYGDTPFGFAPLWREYLSTTYLPLPAPGGYSEVPFVPLTPDSELAPISLASLPTDIRVGFTFSDYAGGVVQIGIYQDGQFVPLCSFQHVGLYFPEWQVAPGAWEELPPPIDGSYFSVSNEEGAGSEAFLRLAANVPPTLFWTQLKQAVEV